MKILMVVLQFPPMSGMAVSRIYGFAKYWYKLGADITIITPKKHSFFVGNLDFFPEDTYFKSANVIEVEYLTKFRFFSDNNKTDSKTKNATNVRSNSLKKWIRKIRYNMIGNSFDVNFLWEKAVFRACKRELQRKEYDVVFTSFTPQASLKVGYWLKRYDPRLFWICDYRDLWTQNHILKMHPVVKYFQTKKERRLVSYSDMITTTSPAFAEALQMLHKRDIEVFTNGYDSEYLSGIDPEPFFDRDGKVRIVHVGTIYQNVRDPRPLFEAVQRLMKEERTLSRTLEVIFYGDNANLGELIKQYDVKSLVKEGGILSKEDALRAQRDADILLLLDNVDEASLSAQGMIPAKVYEYIYFKKPIFAIGVTDRFFTGELVTKSGLGRAYGWDDKALYHDIKAILKQNFLVRANETYINTFDRAVIAKSFLQRVKKGLDAKRG